MTQSQMKKELKKRLSQLKKVNYSQIGGKVARSRKFQGALGVLAAGLCARFIWAKTHQSPVDKILKHIK